MTVIAWLLSADIGWYPARLLYIVLPAALVVALIAILWYTL